MDGVTKDDFDVTLQAIDRLPVVPGLMELVGIGYSGVRCTSEQNFTLECTNVTGDCLALRYNIFRFACM